MHSAACLALPSPIDIEALIAVAVIFNVLFIINLIFVSRAETTGQIPALQTVVREEKETGEGEEPGGSGAEAGFFYGGSVQWSRL